MSVSLKSALHKLAGPLGLTEHAAYERVRALVREGLLSAEGRGGPGSGVRASYEVIATLLICILATDSVADAGERTRQLAEARTGDRRRCPLTGKTNFRSALAAILADRELAANVSSIRVSRTYATAGIVYDPLPGDGDYATRFVASEGKAPSFIKVQAEIETREIRSLVDIVAEIIGGSGKQ